MQKSDFQMTRKQLYDEIWSISTAGVSRKYDVPYSRLMKEIKQSNIAIPPSGYWTKLECGKPVEKVELTGDFDEIVTVNTQKKQKKNQKVNSQ